MRHTDVRSGRAALFKRPIIAGPLALKNLSSLQYVCDRNTLNISSNCSV